MPTAKEFAREVEALALTITGYKKGKRGQNGLCDCIGLVIGAMARFGRGSYDLRSTNYFARYQMTDLRPLGKTEKLQLGQIVYKANTDQSDLNERYKAGGTHHKGDSRNYYHIGAVTDTDPLEITHCTSGEGISGIARDSSVKGWTHVGELNGVEYVADTNVGNNEEDKTMSKTAYVVSPDGKGVRLRNRPSDSGGYNTIVKVSPGTVVDVPEQAGEWATVITPDGKRGYMKKEFLKFLEYADDELDLPTGENQPEETAPEVVMSGEEITITLPKSAALDLYRALMKVVDG